MKAWLGASCAVLLAALVSRPADGAPPQTIDDLIAACGSNERDVQEQQCSQVFQKMYGTALMSETGLGRPDHYVSCLPKLPDRIEGEAQAREAILAAAAEFETKLLAYLRAHPEMRTKHLVN